MAGQLAEAEQRWRAYVGPEAARLEAAIEEGRRAVEELVASYERQMAQSRPLLERRQMLLRSSEQLAVGLGRYRDRVDGGDSRTARPVPPTSSGRSKCRPLVISRQSTAPLVQICDPLKRTRRQGHYVGPMPAFGPEPLPPVTPILRAAPAGATV